MIIAALCRPNQTGEIRYRPYADLVGCDDPAKHQADLIAAENFRCQGDPCRAGVIW